MRPVYIIGAGMTRFGILKESITELIQHSALEALNSGGVLDQKIDHIIVSSQNPDEFTGIGHLSTLAADRLGLVPAGATRVESGPSSGGSALETGFAMIASSLADLVLIVGVEKMSEVERGIASKILSRMMSNENETRYGATPASLAAMIARRYMHDYGLTRDELSLVPVKAHKNGAKNPKAHFQKEIDVEKVNSSPIVADPLTLYDCCPTSDGAAALVLASQGLISSHDVSDRAVRIAGIGHATDHHAVQHRQSLTSMSATVIAARKAFEMAKLEPKDIDVAELHDAFSILEIIDLEDIGFVERGSAMHAIKDGRTSIHGDIPINTTGGLKARGHPTGATGIAQAHDIYQQLMGIAPKGLQVDSPRVGLTHNIGGFGNNMTVCIFTTD